MIKSNFLFHEFILSGTAEKLGLKNIPDWESIANLESLVFHVLQPLRDFINVPIYINSGFRCPSLNAALKGAKNSQHLRGRAADITTYKSDLDDALFSFIQKSLSFDQVIRYDNFVHVSYVGTDNRHQVIDYRTKR